MTFAFLALFGNSALADRLCGSASFNCVNPQNPSQQMIVSKTEVRFCRINTELTRDEIDQKAAFLQYCSELDGMIVIGSRNK